MFLAVLLLAGCASVGDLSADSPPAVKREVVAARAKARWEALIRQDAAAAYEFLSPASKKTMPLDLYKAKHKLGLYRAAEVKSVNCEVDVCTVDLLVTYDYKRVKGIVTRLEERWVIAQGQAWYVQG